MTKRNNKGNSVKDTPKKSNNDKPKKSNDKPKKSNDNPKNPMILQKKI